MRQPWVGLSGSFDWSQAINARPAIDASFRSRTTGTRSSVWVTSIDAPKVR
jgi:hypothetical protein